MCSTASVGFGININKLLSSSAIIQNIEGMRTAESVTMAYYHFGFRDVKTQDRYGLLSSLVLQLSAELDSCYGVLSQLYSDHGSGARKPTTSSLTKCLKDMLNLPGQGPNIQRDELWSPLHLASANGHLKIAKLLVQRGASVDVNDKQETPHYQAVSNGIVAIHRLLIDHGANLHSADSNGCTLLHAASQRGHLGVVKLLLQRGADVDILNKANKTVAEMASKNDKARSQS